MSSMRISGYHIPVSLSIVAWLIRHLGAFVAPLSVNCVERSMDPVYLKLVLLSLPYGLEGTLLKLLKLERLPRTTSTVMIGRRDLTHDIVGVLIRVHQEHRSTSILEAKIVKFAEESRRTKSHVPNFASRMNEDASSQDLPPYN